ncbi:hypothetical protein BAE44_0019040, partial [Dichanthelium oligosanthes]
LLEICLRLPSLATLVRAALTCRVFRRAVASSPSFRRRFRALHPPPLLGFFFEPPSPVETPNSPAFPTFVPARRRDRDIAAAVRCGDFFLNSLEDLPDEGPCWEIVDCCRGCVLLKNWDDASLVVFNPLRVLRVGLDNDTVLNHLADDHSDLSVLAARDDYVHLSTSAMYYDPQNPCLFLSLCLETMRLERLFRRTFDNAVHPYIMAWPSSLVDNYGRFALEDALCP